MKPTIKILLALLFMTQACSDDATVATDAATLGSCSVSDVDAGARIRCDDGTEFVVPAGPAGETGSMGKAGKPGPDGMDGTGCSVEESGGSAVVTCPDGSSVTITRPATDGGLPGRTAWLTAAGLKLSLMSVTVDAERYPVATLKLTDAEGAGIDRLGVQTEGAVSPRFTLAFLRGDASGFESYLLAPQTSPITDVTENQPTSDQDGEWTAVDADAGIYAYRFSVALPSDYDPALTHRVAVWGTRSIGGVTYPDDDFIDFRPDGDSTLQERQVTSTETCNGCHNPLALHGSQRLSIELCATCHTSQAVDPDTGNSLDLKVMVHKIHMGDNLPSVKGGQPYQIIGFRQSVHDYSEVAFPQEINHCPTCHTGTDAAVWSNNPSVEACGSCHDDVDFSLQTLPAGAPAWMKIHQGGPREDGTCTTCHKIGGITGLSIQQSHERGKFNPNTPTFAVEILDVTNTGATDTPTIEFRVLVDGSPRDLSADELERLRFVLAGPTTGIEGQRSYTVTQATDLTPTTGGAYSYTLPETLETAAGLFSPSPVAAAGSFSLMVEAQEKFNVPYTNPVNGEILYEVVNFGVKNPVTTITISGSPPVPRPAVVSDAKCSNCHRQLQFHGGSRNTADACVFCHIATLDNVGRMPDAPAGETVAIPNLRFGPMIHRIHGSQIAKEPYVLYGYSGDAMDFTHVAFPGDVQDCQSCHVAGAYDLPLTKNLAPSILREKDENGVIVSTKSVGPTTAACTGCHDSAAAKAHAGLMTTGSGEESCATCHGPGRTFGVDIVHARPQWQ